MVVTAFSLQPSIFSFEESVQATLTRGGETQTLQYTVAITILFPHNRSFVRLRTGAPAPSDRACASSSSVEARSLPMPTF